MTESPNEIPIPVPKELVNDDAYLVAALFIQEGERVARDQILAELETSKSAFTLLSPADGYCYPNVRAGDMLGVGEVFGVVAAAPRQSASDSAAAAPAAPRADPRFSAAAWELFRAGDVPLAAFDGLTHVRRRDVEAALARRDGGAAAVTADPFAALAAMDGAEKERAVALLGGGGHARECAECIERAAALRIVGLFDTRAAPGALVAGYPVLGNNADLERLFRAGIRNLALAYGIAGDPAARGRHFRELVGRGFLFPPIIHPLAAVNRHARVGRGVQVMPGVVLGSDADVGDACILNSNAVVSHDCVLGENVHIAPGAVLAGGVRVGRDTVIGMGATVHMRVRVGSGAVIHNGSRVFHDVPDGAVVTG